MNELKLKTIQSDKEGSPVTILIHGGPGMDHSYFLPYLEELKEVSEIVLYDLGHTHLAPYSINSLIEELAAVTKRFENRDLILIGHSFGSALILEYLKERAKSDIIGLVFISWIYDGEWFKERSLDVIETSKKLSERAFSKEISVQERTKLGYLAFLEHYFSPSFQTIGEKLLEDVRYNSQLQSDFWETYLTSFDCKHVLKALDLPLLSIIGERDPIVKASYTKKGHALTPNVVEVNCPEAFHFPFVEANEHVLTRIKSFIHNIHSSHKKGKKENFS